MLRDRPSIGASRALDSSSYSYPPRQFFFNACIGRSIFEGSETVVGLRCEGDFRLADAWDYGAFSAISACERQHGGEKDGGRNCQGISDFWHGGHRASVKLSGG